jgi:hypothetical protein
MVLLAVRSEGDLESTDAMADTDAGELRPGKLARRNV